MTKIYKTKDLSEIYPKDTNMNYILQHYNNVYLFHSLEAVKIAKEDFIKKDYEFFTKLLMRKNNKNNSINDVLFVYSDYLDDKFDKENDLKYMSLLQEIVKHNRIVKLIMIIIKLNEEGQLELSNKELNKLSTMMMCYVKVIDEY